MAIRRAIHGALLNLAPTVAYYLAYVLILLRALAGQMTVGGLTLVSGAFARSRSIMENVVASLVGISEQALFIKDLFRFSRNEPQIVSKPDALPAPRTIRRGFEFENVSFSYPGSSHAVLSDLSFRFYAGERIALVGGKRCGVKYPGKTTSQAL